MKFFTKELWASWERPDAASDASDEEWARLLETYRAETEQLRHRVPASAFEFFVDAPIHDGALRSFRVNQTTGEPWDASEETEHPLVVEIEAAEESGRVWQIQYTSVRRILLEHPSAEPLFVIGGEGLGDWGYHELSDAGSGYLRHEVLFATGASLLVEFRAVTAQVTSATPDAMSSRRPQC